MSAVVQPPELPKELTRNLFPLTERPRLGGWSPFVWLEPNTVEVRGQIRVFTRCVIDQYATAHVAGVLDYDPESHQMSFTQLTSWPGGQCKFFVIHDRDRSMY